MRTPFIAGNWKMHKTLPEARELVSDIVKGLEGITGVDVLICTPYTLLFPIAKAVANTPVMFGAQNAHEEAQGAFTGEISVAMVKDTGATHIIIGHSERRQIFGESGDRLAKKARAVITGGLNLIFCVGETLEQRESGKMKDVVGKQIDEAINAEITPDRLIIAYEPVWAIGTGKTATPEQAQEMHAFVRSKLVSIYDDSAADSIRILYGGSVKPGNAATLLAQSDIDGALVGGACLVSDDFIAIIKASVAEAAPVK